MQQPIPAPGPREWIAILGAILGSFMAVLDIQITNASLKDIQGALSATLEEGSWISTSYLVAEIIIIPMTGWLMTMLSLRRYIVITSALFTLFSLLCSMAWNLESMIVFRALQGLAGGALIPLAFTIIMTKLPPEQQAKGMALFGLTATFAPAIGPTLGGWLTESFGWQYIFYINLVPGILMVLMLAYGLRKTAPDWSLFRRGDWWGMLTMAVGLGSLEIFLEEGQREDWFASPFILKLALVSAVALTAFVVIQLRRQTPLVNLRLLSQRNFAVASSANLLLGLGLYGSVYLLPLYLASIHQYSAMQIGMVIMWLGLPQLLMMPLVPKLMQRIAPRYLVSAGFTLFAASCLMTSGLNLDYAGDQFLLPQIIRAIGQPLIMLPLGVIVTQGVAHKDAPSASSLFNILRNLGGALGIALLATLVDQRSQFHLWRLKESLTATDTTVLANLAQLQQQLVWRGLSPDEAGRQALAMTGQLAQREAAIMAYNDAFLVVGAGLSVAAVLLLTLLKNRRPEVVPLAKDNAGKPAPTVRAEAA